MRQLSPTNTETPESTGNPILAIGLVSLIGILCGYFWWIGDQVAMVSLGLIDLGCVVGYWYGIWRTVGSSVGVWAGCQLAAPSATHLVPILEKQFGQSVPTQTGLLLSGIAAGTLATLIFWMVGKVVFRRSRFLKRCDQYAGFTFGFANAVALVALVLWGVLASEPEIKRRQQMTFGAKSEQADQISQRLNQILVATKNSYVMVALRGWNPFLELPQLKKIKQQFDAMIAQKSSSKPNHHGLLEDVEPSQGLEMQRLIQTMFNGEMGGIK